MSAKRRFRSVELRPTGPPRAPASGSIARGMAAPPTVSQAVRSLASARLAPSGPPALGIERPANRPRSSAAASSLRPPFMRDAAYEPRSRGATGFSRVSDQPSTPSAPRSCPEPRGPPAAPAPRIDRPGMSALAQVRPLTREHAKITCHSIQLLITIDTTLCNNSHFKQSSRQV
jgi:hypothetical protein